MDNLVILYGPFKRIHKGFQQCHYKTSGKGVDSQAEAQLLGARLLVWSVGNVFVSAPAEGQSSRQFDAAEQKWYYLHKTR